MKSKWKIKAISVEPKEITGKEMNQRIEERGSLSNQRKEIERRIQSIEAKIEALTERLSQLPKSVSAEPIFRQLEVLQNGLKGEQERLSWSVVRIS